MTLDEHYICQRAANAIISEIGPFRVSTDALQAINQFLDEFIVLLLTCSLSLDLSQIKSIVVSLLPSTLGKNAIVEAELEVKTFTETESIDYELYERMRNLGSEGGQKFPLDEAVPLLREKCFEYCTLADKDDQLYLQNSIRKNKARNTEQKVIISPIVAIYVTTVMEHIAEYLLTAVAMTAEHEETDYVRVKEVFLALIDDIQLGDVFNRMDLRDKMEKRAGLAPIRARNSYLPPSSPNPMMQNRKSYTLDHPQNENGSFLDITFDDLDLDYFENPRKSTASRIPEIARPQSAMSHSSQYTTNTSNNGNRKSTFHLFKNNRNSFSGGDVVPPRASSPIPSSSAASVYDPDGGSNTSMNFDDLIKSGGTVKVSLTPNRLRSIEIKDTKKDELAPPTWERRSTSTSPRLSAAGGSSTRPSSPLVRQNTSNSTRSSNSKRSNSALGSHQEEEQPLSIEVPKINSMRPSTPSSPLGKKSFSVSEKSKFENPRDAPKPPTTTTPLSPTISLASISSSSISKTSNIVLPPPILNKSPVVSPTNSTNNKISGSSLPIPPATIKKTLAPLPKLSSSQPQVSYVASTPVIAAATATTNNNKTAAIPSTYSSDSISSEISSVPSIPSPITATSPPSSDTLSIKSNNASTTTISIQEPPIPRPTKSITPLNTNGMVIRRSSVSNKKSRDNLRSRVKEEQQQQKTSPLNDEPVPTKVVETVGQQEEAEVKVEEKEEVKEEQEEEVLLTEEPAQLDSPANRQVRFDDVSSEPATTTEATTTDEQTGQETVKPEEETDATGAVIPRVKKAATLSPERPSSMVAKRASMVGNNRRRSLHESYAAEKYHQDVLLRQRVSTVGSVSVSIKQWDDILKPEEQQVTVIPPASHRRSVLRQLRQQQLKEQQSQLEQQQQDGEGGVEGAVGGGESNGTYLNNNNSNAVLDKVLKFERASSLDDVAHQRVSHMPRRERFLYLQQDPSAIERKSTVTTTTQKTATALTRATPNLLKRHVVGIDQGIQTDPETVIERTSKKEQEQQGSEEEDEEEEEEGEVDGDEEWFLQDDEWDEQEETAIVEWLLGE